MLSVSSVLIPLAVPSEAAPSKAQVEAAKAKLQDLDRQMELVVEQYNTAREQLHQSEAKLAEARAARQAANSELSQATTRLEERAVEAYMGTGSQAGGLLGAQDIAEFTDRLEYMGVLARGDSELATQATNARVKAGWAAQRYDAVVADRQTQADTMLGRLKEIKGLLGQQELLYRQTNADYQSALAEQQAAAEQAQQQAQQSADNPAIATEQPSVATGPLPPASGSAAQTAIAAAKSVIGVQYIFGTADPSVGFDCSGLTLWAYARAGVSLPHSSQMQYDVLPHLSRDQIQPGDLLFFFNPIHHVAIYLGGNSMIDTVHPGADGAVAIRSVWWDLYVGAARPS